MLKNKRKISSKLNSIPNVSYFYFSKKMKRIIHIKNLKQLKSQTVKTQIKRFLKRRGRLSNVELIADFKVSENSLNTIKEIAFDEFKRGVKLPQL